MEFPRGRNGLFPQPVVAEFVASHRDDAHDDRDANTMSATSKSPTQKGRTAYDQLLSDVNQRVSDPSNPGEVYSVAEDFIRDAVDPEQPNYKYLTGILNFSYFGPTHSWDEAGFDNTSPDGALLCLATSALGNDVLNYVNGD